MTGDFYCDSVLSGKVPVRVVAESETILAFEHTEPTWEIHIVVIPKQHIRQLTDVENGALFSELFQAMAGIIRARGFDRTNYKIITNGGSYQSSAHLHFHLVSGMPLDAGNAAQRGEQAV